MLKRSRVFLDTEVFVGECFNFESTKLAEIRRLASLGSILIVTTNVTIKETKRRIEKMIRAARNALKDKGLRFTLSILQQTSVDCSVLKSIDVDVLSRELQEKFDKYLSDCKAEIVDASEISAQTILDAYFAGEPPFGVGQKKDQFPDAVVVAALEGWKSKHKGQLFIVSNDPDLSSVCAGKPDLCALKSVSEFLDQHNKNQQEQSDFVTEQIKAKSDEIKEQIKDQFLNQGFTLIGRDGDVEDVEVDRIELGVISILALHDDHALAEVEANVRFSAVARYHDPDTGYYDRETGMSYGMETISRNIVREKNLAVEVELFWEDEELDYIDIYIGLPDVEVEIDEPHWY